MVAEGGRLALSWVHRVDDPAVMRVMAPQPMPRPSDPKPRPRPVRWQPKVDWLYRQYVAGVGEKPEAAETSLRSLLGAAAGWIDRPLTEEEAARLLVKMMPRIASGRETSEIGLLKVVPAVLSGDQAAVRTALGKAKDQVARTDYYVNLIRAHVERGGRPSEGKMPNDEDGTGREGWTGNPCYHAALMPCFVRVYEHFELPFPQQAYHEAILRYADFSIDILSGQRKTAQGPIDFDKLNTTFQREWPSRIVPMIPLTLHAHTLKPEAKYTRAAKLLFDDLLRLVERNPHGYFPVWTFNPKADRYDTVYNPVSYERGLTAFWSEGKLDVIGRAAAARFVAAQARWLVFSGQMLDTLETDNATAIRASTHGGHTGIRNQVGIYLYDDFAFYRGLLGDLLAWSAAACQVPGPVDDSGVGAYRSLTLSNGSSTMLRWALAIRPGSKWLESKVLPLPPSADPKEKRKGFHLSAWNRLPQARPTIKVTAREAGLPTDADLCHLQLTEPAYRQPQGVTVSWNADVVTVIVARPAKIRLGYRLLKPDGKERPVLTRRRADGSGVPLRAGVVWQDDWIEWQAEPGHYELQHAQQDG
jgi:hypothetical protein